MSEELWKNSIPSEHTDWNNISEIDKKINEIYDSIPKEVLEKYINKFWEEFFKETMIKNLLKTYYRESVIPYIEYNVGELDKLTKKDIEKIKNTWEFSTPIRDTIWKVSNLLKKLIS